MKLLFEFIFKSRKQYQNVINLQIYFKQPIRPVFRCNKTYQLLSVSFVRMYRSGIGRRLSNRREYENVKLFTTLNS